jgi:glycosyltransferase involved in cell wall biosynthesis
MIFLATLLAVGFRKTVVFIHGWDVKVEKKIRSSKVICGVFRFFFDRTMATLVLATTFKESLYQMGFFSSEIDVFTMMFDGDLFKGRAIGKNVNGKRLIFLSRLVREKGVYELLEAFEVISRRFPGTELIIAGDGPELEEMRTWVEHQHLSDRVRFKGYLRGTQKAKALINADIFVFPTYYPEGCPISLLEAMAAGLAVITTPVGGIPDVFIHGQNGILLDNVTPNNIAEAVEKLLDDEAFLTKVKENNRRKAWQEYEASIVTRRIEAIFRKVGRSEQKS